MKVNIEAEISKGFIFESADHFHQSTVCNKIVITAIGEDAVLARDVEGVEHMFRFSYLATHFKCVGFK